MLGGTGRVRHRNGLKSMWTKEGGLGNQAVLLSSPLKLTFPNRLGPFNLTVLGDEDGGRLGVGSNTPKIES
jgi:hypothetical protein